MGNHSQQRIRERLVESSMKYNCFKRPEMLQSILISSLADMRMCPQIMRDLSEQRCKQQRGEKGAQLVLDWQETCQFCFVACLLVLCVRMEMCTYRIFICLPLPYHPSATQVSKNLCNPSKGSSLSIAVTQTFCFVKSQILTCLCGCMDRVTLEHSSYFSFFFF